MLELSCRDFEFTRTTVLSVWWKVDNTYAQLGEFICAVEIISFWKSEIEMLEIKGTK